MVGVQPRVGDPLCVGGQDELRSAMGMAPTMGGMGSTLAHQSQHGLVATATSFTQQGMGAILPSWAQHWSFVFTAPLSRQQGLGPSTAHSTQQGLGTSTGPSGRQMAGPSGTHSQHGASGPSTGPSADLDLALQSGPGVTVAQGIDVSVEDEAVWDEFQMFKLFLQMRKRGNVGTGASTAALPPRCRANPSQTVKTRSPDPVVDDIDQGSDGQPGGDDDNSLQVAGQSQAAGQLQVAGPLQVGVQSTLIQTLAQSLLARGQQDPPPMAAVRVPAVAHKRCHSR